MPQPDTAQKNVADATVAQRIDNLLIGAIDPHVHSGPSIAPRAWLFVSNRNGKSTMPSSGTRSVR